MCHLSDKVSVEAVAMAFCRNEAAVVGSGSSCRVRYVDFQVSCDMKGGMLTGKGLLV